MESVDWYGQLPKDWAPIIKKFNMGKSNEELRDICADFVTAGAIIHWNEWAASGAVDGGGLLVPLTEQASARTDLRREKQCS